MDLLPGCGGAWLSRNVDDGVNPIECRRHLVEVGDIRPYPVVDWLLLWKRVEVVEAEIVALFQRVAEVTTDSAACAGNENTPLCAITHRRDASSQMRASSL